MFGQERKWLRVVGRDRRVDQGYLDGLPRGSASYFSRWPLLPYGVGFRLEGKHERVGGKGFGLQMHADYVLQRQEGQRYVSDCHRDESWHLHQGARTCGKQLGTQLLLQTDQREVPSPETHPLLSIIFHFTLNQEMRTFKKK